MAGAQRKQRARRLRQIFSPSDNSTRPVHYLLHFDLTDSYSIAAFSNISKIVGQTATLDVHGKKTLATIVTSGDT